MTTANQIVRACRMCGRPFDVSPAKARRSDYTCAPCHVEEQRQYRARRRTAGLPVQPNKKKYPESPAKLAERYKRYRSDPVLRQRLDARSKLRRAVRTGKVVRLQCEVCGEAAEAHHDDYSRPLDVRWLCRPHHRALHRGRAA